MTLGDGKVELTIKIDATPAAVFEYLTDPEKVTIWEGLTADISPVAGGQYRVFLPEDNTMRGEFLEITPPTRLVLSFGWENGDYGMAPGSTTVTYELEAEGEGAIVHFTHSGLPDAQAGEHHTSGWTRSLNRVQIAATGGDPGIDSYKKLAGK